MNEEDYSVFELVGLVGDVLTSYGPHDDQVIEVFEPIAPLLGAIALIHGGYWRPKFDRVHLRPLARALAEEGWRSHLVGFRRIPGSPDASVDDVNSALGIIGSCVLIGHSSGGHLALTAQGHQSVQAIIALAPVSDLVTGDHENYSDGAVSEFLGVPAVERLDLNPHSKLITKPTVLMHGCDDTRVPVGQSRNFISAHPTAGYIELEEIGHFQFIDPRQDTFALLINELKKFG